MRNFFLLLGGLIVFFAGVHIWIWIVDTFFKGLKKLNPIKKKQTQKWHSLRKDDIK